MKDHIRVRNLLVLSSLALSVPIASAQVFETPTFFVWGDYPTPTYAVTNPLVKKAIQVNLGKSLRIIENDPNNPSSPYEDSPWDHPEFVADWVAERIRREIHVEGRLLPATVAITIQNFGFDSLRCDAVKNVTEPALGGARYFVPALRPVGDRIAGILEWSDENGPNKFPQPRDINLSLDDARNGCSCPVGTRPDYGSARSYRHPFLKNADPTFNSTTGEWNAPLKEWMQKFVDRLDANYQASLPTLQPLPNPNSYRFNYDTESPIVAHADFNDVFMLKYLSNPSNDFWEDKPGVTAPRLPGYNRTLRAQYIYDHPGVSNPDGLSASLSTLAPAKDAQNRDAMRWYFEVCDRVNEEVMRNCTTAVLQAKWGDQASPPQSAMRCGNYDSFSTDGGTDIFGWFEDRAWNVGGVAASNVNPLVGASTESFTRRMIHKGRGGLMYYIGNQTNPRYVSEITHSCGTLHSPVFYRLKPNELHGDDGPMGAEPGHQRVNYYKPQTSPGIWPVEEEWDSAMRLHRHHAEAIVNSAGGSSATLVPWVQMCASAPDDATARLADDFTTYEETVRLLQMLRGKNIKEALLFTAWYDKFNDPTFQTNLEETWSQTQRAIEQVYESRVHTYRLQRGVIPSPPLPATPSKLEFTLRVGGQDQTVDIPSTLNGQKVTELDVDLSWPSGSSAAPLIGTYTVNLMIECASTKSTTIGEALIWDFASQRWTPLNTLDTLSPTYNFVAPRSPGDLRYRARQEMGAILISNAVVKQTDSSDGILKSRIRLRHTNSTVFQSYYDLVQLRVTLNEGTFTLEAPQESYRMSDINLDGVVDSSDLVQFLDEWTGGVPAADLNVDSSIDAADIDNFVEDYTAIP